MLTPRTLPTLRRTLYVVLSILAMMLPSACGKQEPVHPVVELLNPMTPVKNQGTYPSCWIYAMLAAIETEHIAKGDSVNLSPAWIESHLKEEPLAPQTGRGMGATALELLQKYGVVGYDAMRKSEAPRPVITGTVPLIISHRLVTLIMTRHYFHFHTVHLEK